MESHIAAESSQQCSSRPRRGMFSVTRQIANGMQETFIRGPNDRCHCEISTPRRVTSGSGRICGPPCDWRPAKSSRIVRQFPVVDKRWSPLSLVLHAPVNETESLCVTGAANDYPLALLLYVRRGRLSHLPRPLAFAGHGTVSSQLRYLANREAIIRIVIAVNDRPQKSAPSSPMSGNSLAVVGSFLGAASDFCGAACCGFDRSELAEPQR